MPQEVWKSLKALGMLVALSGPELWELPGRCRKLGACSLLLTTSTPVLNK